MQNFEDHGILTRDKIVKLKELSSTIEIKVWCLNKYNKIEKMGL